MRKPKFDRQFLAQLQIYADRYDEIERAYRFANLVSLGVRHMTPSREQDAEALKVQLLNQQQELIHAFRRRHFTAKKKKP